MSNIPDVSSAVPDSPEDANASRGGTTAGGDRASPTDDQGIEIQIERDLAVQIVGSDAGRRMRIRPHGAMTRGASAREEAEVNELMQPFLDDEIRRVTSDKAHRPRVSKVTATTGQALALRGYCLRYAASIRQHLDKHPKDDRLHRSRQRLEQAYRVIDQINAGLGAGDEDGRTLEEFERRAIALVEDLEPILDSLERRAGSGERKDSIRALLDLRAAVRSCLGHLRSA